MNTRILLQLKSLASRIHINRCRLALCSSSVFVLSAGFYGYHSSQQTTSFVGAISSENTYKPPSSKNESFSRISIPSGKATVINPNNKETDVEHIVITVHGEGEVNYYSPEQDKVIYGNDNVMINGPRIPIITKELKMGNSVSIPSTKWHQIVNKHEKDDLVLVVTSVPHNNK